MKKFAFIIFASAFAAGCAGHQQPLDPGASNSNNDSTSTLSKIDTSSNPKVSVKVNKKFDSKGNLVSYDSSYSYLYTSPGGKMKRVGSDTVYSNFKDFFEKSYVNLFDKRMNDIFFNDSLFRYDFFNPDYFSKRYQMNGKDFDKFFRRMDSIKMDYLNQKYPGGQLNKKIKP